VDAGQRERYLAAMGIQSWVPRGGEPDPGAAEPVAEPAAVAAPAVLPPAQASAAAVTRLDDLATLDWEALEARVAGCNACGLHATRSRTVFGRGDRQAELMVVGDAPGEEEDARGEPFVGEAGHMLDTMLRAIGYGRGEVCIVNTLKCMTPANREPHVDELAACRQILMRQIELVRPRLILAVGRLAAHTLLGRDDKLAALRGSVHTLPGSDLPVIATYHPAYLIRSPGEKRHSWQDLLRARRELRTRAEG